MTELGQDRSVDHGGGTHWRSLKGGGTRRVHFGWLIQEDLGERMRGEWGVQGANSTLMQARDNEAEWGRQLGIGGMDSSQHSSDAVS